MDPVLLEKAIIDRKEKTVRYPKAIVPVALYGMPYHIDKIMAIAEKYGIPVVEDAAEGMGSRFNGQVLGTFGKYGVLSFNGNKMITTSGGALICRNAEEANEIMWYATQARDAYPYYQHTAIGYNYRMSNVCAGIGRGQMTVLDSHIKHHQHVQKLYEELLADVCLVFIFISSLRIRVLMRISGFVLRRWTRRFMFRVRRMLIRRSSRLLSVVLPV